MDGQVESLRQREETKRGREKQAAREWRSGRRVKESITRVRGRRGGDGR